MQGAGLRKSYAQSISVFWLHKDKGLMELNIRQCQPGPAAPSHALCFAQISIPQRNERGRRPLVRGGPLRSGQDCAQVLFVPHLINQGVLCSCFCLWIEGSLRKRLHQSLITFHSPVSLLAVYNCGGHKNITINSNEKRLTNWMKKYIFSVKLRCD